MARSIKPINWDQRLNKLFILHSVLWYTELYISIKREGKRGRIQMELDIQNKGLEKLRNAYVAWGRD